MDAALPGLLLHGQSAAAGPLNDVVGVFEGRDMEGLLGCHNPVTHLVMEVDYERSLMAYDFGAGILGSRILQRYRVVFGFRRERLLFYERGGLDPGLVDVDKSGMFLVLDVQNRSRVMVVDVVEGSPAAETGIRVGDHLTHVDRVEASKLGLERIRRRFRGPEGTSIPLVLERDGLPFEAALVLPAVI